MPRCEAGRTPQARGIVRPVVDEGDGLIAYLAQQRQVLRVAAYGSTRTRRGATPTASALGVGGLIKHVTMVERRWQATALQRDLHHEGHDAGYLASFCGAGHRRHLRGHIFAGI